MTLDDGAGGGTVAAAAGGGGGGAGTVPGGTLTAGATVFGSDFGGSSSKTRPSCTFFFFPSKSSSSDLKRLELPWSLLASSPLNPVVDVGLFPSSFGPFPAPPARNLVALMFSRPGLAQVTTVVVFPCENLATAAPT